MSPSPNLGPSELAVIRRIVRSELRAAGLRVPSEPTVQNASRTHCEAPYSAVGSHPAVTGPDAPDPTEKAGECVSGYENISAQPPELPHPIRLAGLSEQHANWLTARGFDVREDVSGSWSALIGVSPTSDGVVATSADEIERLRQNLRRANDDRFRWKNRALEGHAAICQIDLRLGSDDGTDPRPDVLAEIKQYYDWLDTEGWDD